MLNKRRDSLVLLVFTLLISVFIFKDTGVFVNNYKGEVEFKEGERVEIIRTKGNIHTILKDRNVYEVPFANLLKLTSSGQVYRTKFTTFAYSSPKGSIKENIEEGALLEIKKAEGDYGLFAYDEEEEAYFLFNDLEMVEVSYVTPALLTESVTLNNGKRSVYLEGLSTIYINDYKNGIYTIQDDKGNEYNIQRGIVKLMSEAEIKNATSRASFRGRNSSDVDKLLDLGRAQIGKRYSYGSQGPNTFDCSGFTSYVYKNALGISISRSSRAQAGNGVAVSKSELQPGDLVFFNTSGRGISHVGIYVGEGNFIHSSSTNRRGVRIDALNSGYYSGRYVTARRILK